MVKYSKVRMERSFLGITCPLSDKKSYLFLIISVLILLGISLASPIYAAGKRGKVAVLPFKIESKKPLDHLSTDLQTMLGKRLSEIGYDIISPEAINSRLGASISYSDIKKDISLMSPLKPDWIILGDLTQTSDNFRINVKVVDPRAAVISFSIMMIEKDISKLPEAMRKAADSLDSQISQNVLIADIVVKGNKRVGADGILNIIESQKGERFDQSKLDRDLRTIYKMGLFSDVSIKTTDVPGGKKVTFTVVEKPQIVEIYFVGNEAYKRDKLLKEIEIKKYSVLDMNNVKQSVNRLLEFYRSKGYYDIKISTKIKNFANNEVTLTYVIKEGNKILIKKIRFVGNKVFSAGTLRKHMATKEKSILSWFTDDGILDRKKLDFDVQRLAAFYNTYGYIMARIGEPEITYNKKEGLVITINIREGHQYFIKDIKFEGDLIEPASRLLALIKIKKGGPFDRKTIYDDMQTLKGLYANAGYAFAEVSPIPEQVKGKYLVNLVFRIRKFKRVRIERINFIGNKRTRDNVIRRELKIVEGQYFSGAKLEKSKAALLRTGYFKSDDGVEYKTRRGSSDDQMIVDFDLKEEIPSSIMLSGGYSGYYGLELMVQYANSNLFGYGDNFQINATLGSVQRLFNMSFTDPWIMGRPVAGTVNLYNWDTIYDYYTRQSKGGSLGLTFLLGLDEYTRGLITYSYENSSITDVLPGTALIIQDMAGSYLTSSVSMGIERDSRDNPLDTTKGSLTTFLYQYAGGPLGGDTAFSRYTLSSTWYLPLKWGTVLVAKGSLGLVEGRSGGTLPIYEKFLLGGIGTIRGYDWGTISPLDPTTLDEVGGNMMWLYKLEYRFPLFKGKGVTGLVFFDAGNSFNRGTSWRALGVRSVGLGIRWHSPMGFLIMDYAFQLNHRPNNTGNGGFEFNMGGSNF